MAVLKWINLLMLALYPVAWCAPLMRAGLLPLFGMSEISVVTGLQALWETDLLLAAIVSLFALVAPYVKTMGLALVQFGLVGRNRLPILAVMGKLATADIFLIAFYITIVKGIGIGRIETAWGLYLFTACILASLLISIAEAGRAVD